MRILTTLDFGNNSKVTNLADGSASKDAINLSQLSAVLSGRYVGYFTATTTEGQTSVSIPSLYQSKGFYLVLINGVPVPPQYVTFSATTITLNASSAYIAAGDLTALVWS